MIMYTLSHILKHGKTKQESDFCYMLSFAMTPVTSTQSDSKGASPSQLLLWVLLHCRAPNSCSVHFNALLFHNTIPQIANYIWLKE